MRKILLGLHLAIVVLGYSSAFAQTEEQVVINLREAVTKAATKEQLRNLSAIVLETAAVRSLQDCNAITQAVTAFTKHASDRLDGKKSPTGYKQSLLTELETVTSLERSALDVYARGVAIFPAETTEELKRAQASLSRGQASLALSFAGFYSLAATLRQTPITLARSEAVLKGIPYDTSKDATVFRAALADMNRAIELQPSKNHFEKRARIHTKLGNTAAAAADTAKAAGLAN